MYIDTLARGLAGAGDDVLVVSEGHPDAPRREILDAGPGHAEIVRQFPYRAGRARKDWMSYLAYARANLDYLRLPAMLKEEASSRNVARIVMLLHSSLLYNASVLPGILDRFRRVGPRQVEMAVDVRDPLVPASLLPLLARFDRAICCSKGITDQLTPVLPSVQVDHIPIPFAEPALPDDAEVVATLERFGLTGQRYVFNPNGVAKAKGFDTMLEAVRALRQRPGYEDVILLSIGRSRDWSEREDRAVAEGVLKFLGPVPNPVALQLASRGLLTLILSKNEGLPRSSLESIGLGQPVIVPVLPEFTESIPSHVAVSDDPQDLAEQMIRVMQNNRVGDYPLAVHGMERLVKQYRQ